MKRALAILSEVQLALIFFLVLTPAGLAMRILRRNPLKLNKDPELESYWLPMPSEGNREMKHPF